MCLFGAFASLDEADTVYSQSEVSTETVDESKSSEESSDDSSEGKEEETKEEPEEEEEEPEEEEEEELKDPKETFEEGACHRLTICHPHTHGRRAPRVYRERQIRLSCHTSTSSGSPEPQYYALPTHPAPINTQLGPELREL